MISQQSSSSSSKNSENDELAPIATERAYTLIRKYGWFITLFIGIGGQFYPQIGLLAPFIMVAMISISFFKGLYFCGNFCPHGSYFDVPLLQISPTKKVPDFLKSKFFAGFVLIFFLINFSWRLISAVQASGDPLHFRLGSMFANIYIVILLIATLLGVVKNSRAWCHFCPMRTVQIGIYNLGKKLGVTSKYDEMVAIEDKEGCIECGRCSKVCPIELEPYPTLKYKQENSFLESDHCMRCRVCIKECPVEVLELKKTGE